MRKRKTKQLLVWFCVWGSHELRSKKDQQVPFEALPGHQGKDAQEAVGNAGLELSREGRCSSFLQCHKEDVTNSLLCLEEARWGFGLFIFVFGTGT